MHHLVYTSSTTVLLTEAGLHRSLGQWQAANAYAGITGVLLYSEGDIMQVLEGEAERVQALFATIAGDGRHRDVTKLADGPVDQRVFADWSMRFRSVPSADFKRFLKPSPSTSASATRLLLLLQAFMSQEGMA